MTQPHKITQPHIYYASKISKASKELLARSRRTVKALARVGNVVSAGLFERKDPAGEDEFLSRRGLLNVPDRDTRLINSSDVTVLDHSDATTGGGWEAAYTVGVLRNPLLSLRRTGAGTKMISQIRHPLVTDRTYADEEELERIIAEYFSAFQPRWNVRPSLVAFEALDGGGKGQLTRGAQEWACAQGLRMFDATHYINFGGGIIPTWDEVKQMVGKVDVILINEPPDGGIGKEVRWELTRKGAPYSMESTAQGYALAREILYRRLLEKALEEGVLVVTDRSYISSLVYQPIQADLFEGMSREYAEGYVLGLPGNRYAAGFTPGLLVVPHVDADIAMDGLEKREKRDDNRFETRDFQKEVEKVYADHPMWDRFRTKGMHIVSIDRSAYPLPEDTRRAAGEILDSHWKQIKG